MGNVLPEVRVRVPAKVNLSLAVGPADGSGYHQLATVFQALSLYDDIQASSTEPGTYRLSFRGEGAAFLPTDDTNLAIRAAKLLARRFDVRHSGVQLMIRKRIPVAGGMAGGSADAAGVLVACNELWGLGASQEELLELGAELGADVPFLLVGGTALGTERGDVVMPVLARGEYFWTLALSHSGLSTPSVFNEFDTLEAAPLDPVVSEDLTTALAQGDVPAVGAALQNDLTQAAISLQPILSNILQIGLDAGALGGLISGSGPTCAFLSDSATRAEAIAEELSIFSGVRAVRCAHGPVAGAHVVS